MTTKSRPTIATWRRPEEIIGRENLSDFIRHFTLCENLKNEDEKKRERILNKEFGYANRQEMGKTIDNLYDHGYVPKGVKDGRMKWLTRTMSPSDEEFFHGNNYGPSLAELEKLSTKELQDICRKKGFAGVVAGLSMP